MLADLDTESKPQTKLLTSDPAPCNFVHTIHQILKAELNASRVNVERRCSGVLDVTVQGSLLSATIEFKHRQCMWSYLLFQYFVLLLTLPPWLPSEMQGMGLSFSLAQLDG